MLTGPKSSQIYKNSKDNISKKCFKNRYGVNFLQMPLQVNKSLGYVPFLADSVRTLGMKISKPLRLVE